MVSALNTRGILNTNSGTKTKCTEVAVLSCTIKILVTVIAGALCFGSYVEICGNGIDDNSNGQVDENCGPCANATNLRTATTSASAVLSWSAPVDPKQWQIQYKKLATGTKWTTITLSGLLRSYTLAGLLSAQKYKWSIRAKCGNGWTSYSYEVELRTLTAGRITPRCKEPKKVSWCRICCAAHNPGASRHCLPAIR